MGIPAVFFNSSLSNDARSLTWPRQPGHYRSLSLPERIALDAHAWLWPVPVSSRHR